MADGPGTTAVDEYRNAATAIRENAKWGLKSQGAVAAALIAGLGLSSLANLHSVKYLALALGGIALALVGVGALFYMTARIMAPSTVSIKTVIDAKQSGNPKYLGPLVKAEDEETGALAPSFATLLERANAASAARAHALLTNYNEPSDISAKNAEAAQSRAQLYNSAVRAIEAHAAYREISSRVHPRLQLLAAVAVAVGVGVFAVALALPTDPKPDFHGAKLTRVSLGGTRLVDANFNHMQLRTVSFRDADLRNADFDGATLRSVNLLGADVSKASFDGVSWHDTTCPDGSNSDLTGGTCKQHMEVRAASAAPMTPSKPHSHSHLTAHTSHLHGHSEKREHDDIP